MSLRRYYVIACDQCYAETVKLCRSGREAREHAKTTEWEHIKSKPRRSWRKWRPSTDLCTQCAANKSSEPKKRAAKST